MGFWHMKNFSKYITIIASFAFGILASAQSISWQKTPQWDNAEMLGEKLVRVTSTGKHGVINLTGAEIISCNYTRIASIRDNRFLVIGNDNKLVSIWDEVGNQIPFSGRYYVDGAWPYYSGGLLAVRDEKGLWGFLNLSGNLTIQCKFAAAFPFVSSQAAVCYKDGYWAHIAADGKPVLLKGQKLRSKMINFASTFTQIGDRQLSLVCIEDYMYLIDPSGDVVGTSLIPSEGQPLYGVGIGPQIMAGNFTVRFNDLGEVETIIKNGAKHSFKSKGQAKDYNFPAVAEIDTMGGKSISTGNLTTVPQFEKVVPLTPNTVLVLSDGKWGIIKIDNLSQTPSIKESDDMQQLYLDHASQVTGTFKVENIMPNTIAYIEKNVGEIVQLNMKGTLKDCFDAPLYFNNGKLIARLGLIIDGIKLTAQDYSITPTGFNKAYSVSCPSTVIVSEGGKASFRLTITNTSTSQSTAPFDLRVNGSTVRRSIILEPGESTTVPASMSINLGDEDKVIKNVDIRIIEQGCPVVNLSKSISCMRQL